MKITIVEWFEGNKFVILTFFSFIIMIIALVIPYYLN